MLKKRDMKSYLFLSSSSALNILKFTTRIYILPSVAIFPVSYCNLDCIMCGCGKKKIKKKEKMEFSIMEKIIIECSNFFFKPKVHFSGFGEPLMYPKIKEAMQLCKHYKLRWSMTTNGYLLEKHIEDIISNHCSALNISIHGDASEHDRITRVNGSFEKAIRAIKKIDHIKRTRNTDRPLIAINSVLNNSNVLYLDQILSVLTKLPVNSITFQHLLFSEADLKKRKNFLIAEPYKIDTISEFIKSAQNGDSTKVNFFPKIKPQDIHRYYTDRDYGFNASCTLPWLSVKAYPNGDVKCCNFLFGNLRKDSLKSIINNPRARKFRDLVKKGKYNIPLCFRCCHRHYY